MKIDEKSITKNNLKVKQFYKIITRGCKKKNPLIKVDWGKEEKLFEKKFNTPKILTFDGFYLRRKISKIIKEILIDTK